MDRRTLDWLLEGGNTDKYFLRSGEILRELDIDPYVRYQVFSRKDGTVAGVGEAAEYIRAAAGDDVRIYARKDGDRYRALEPIMKLEGPLQDLVELETVYLGLISGALTGDVNRGIVRKNAKDIADAALDKPLSYFGARHFDPRLDYEISRICKDAGFGGASTDVGASAWGQKGLGTIPHALILGIDAYMREKGRYGNPTVGAARAFDEVMPAGVPRIALIDAYNREIDDSIAVLDKVPSVSMVRIDTCGENVAQGVRGLRMPKEVYESVDRRYLRENGVSLPAVWALRCALNENGYADKGIVVSSGFDADKTRAFADAERIYKETSGSEYGNNLFDSIGTGSVYPACVMTTSDIVAYQDRGGNWKPLSKAGRSELYGGVLEAVP